MIRAWKKSPALFVHDNFGVEPDAWQLDVLNVFPSQEPDKMRQSMQACVGPGKSAVLAWLGWNFMACYATKGEHPKGAAVAITSANLSDNLWAELSKWRSRSQFLVDNFEWTKSRVFAKAHPETWFISARSWPKTADAEEQGRVLSGLHSEYVIYLIDESGDIPPAVLRAAEQGLSNCVWGKILQAGNPTSHDGMLYLAATTQRHQWHITCITSDPDDPKRSPRVDIEWAKDQIEKYGRDNPWVMSSVLGQFPPSAINTLLSPQDVEDAMHRSPEITEYQYMQKRIGIDVARFGSDMTVLFPRQGLAAFTPTEMRHARSEEIVARLMTMKHELQSEVEFIDDTGGYAAGVVDGALVAGNPLIPVNFASQANDPRYFNRRSEMWLVLADWVKRGGAIPPNPTLARELTTPTYTFHKGKLRLEEKDQIKKRLGFSPDYADALALTFALPDMPGMAMMPEPLRAQHHKMKAEFDPFRDIDGPGMASDFDPYRGM